MTEDWDSPCHCRSETSLLTSNYRRLWTTFSEWIFTSTSFSSHFTSPLPYIGASDDSREMSEKCAGRKKKLGRKKEKWKFLRSREGKREESLLLPTCHRHSTSSLPPIHHPKWTDNGDDSNSWWKQMTFLAFFFFSSCRCHFDVVAYDGKFSLFLFMTENDYEEWALRSVRWRRSE